MKEKNFFVYKYVDINDNIIYIGQTTDLRNRVWQHNQKADKIQSEISKIYYYRCQHQTEMIAYEYFLIRKYHPKYNVVFVDELKCDIEDPNWLLYKSEDFAKSTVLKRKPKGKPVLCIETGIVYDNAREVERQTGIPHTNIYQVCTGKRQTAHKMHWKYL